MMDKTTKQDSLLFDFIKKFNLLILVSIPTYTALGMFIEWFYLFQIGRNDIFMRAVSGENLITIGFTFSIILIFVSIFICLPSIILTLAPSFFPKIFDEEINKPNQIIKYALITSSIAILTFFGSVFFDLSYLWIIVALVIICPASYFAWRVKINHSIDEFRKKEKKLYKSKLCIIFVLIITVCFSFIPLIFTLKLIKGESPFAIIIGVIICVVISIFSYLPASIYFNDYFRTKNIYKALKGFICGLLFIPVVVSMLTSIFLQNIVYHSFLQIGVINEQGYSYLIDEKKHGLDLFNDPVWNKRSSQSDNSKYIVDGINVFSTSNFLLLCPVHVGPILSEAFILDLDKYFEDYSKKQRLRLKSETESCRLLELQYAQRMECVKEN